MIDGIALPYADFKYEKYITSDMQNHWGITLYVNNGEFITIFDRKEVEVIAGFLNDFLSDENNR